MFIKEKYEKYPALSSPTPHTFSDLMEMYEANYIRLRLLCGDINQLPDQCISLVEGAVPIELTVQARAKHTTHIMLTYCFDHLDKDVVKRPDLKIRVYHDARQAEVISRQCNITGETLRPWERDVDSLLLCRWRLNRFLYKWAGYLHRQGHNFSE
jgi:uncharacterized protein YqiB (DUF1249 family)